MFDRRRQKARNKTLGFAALFRGKNRPGILSVFQMDMGVFKKREACHPEAA
jgi:hypothetical protein